MGDIEETAAETSKRFPSEGTKKISNKLEELVSTNRNQRIALAP